MVMCVSMSLSVQSWRDGSAGKDTCATSWTEFDPKERWKGATNSAKSTSDLQTHIIKDNFLKKLTVYTCIYISLWTLSKQSVVTYTMKRKRKQTWGWEA